MTSNSKCAEMKSVRMIQFLELYKKHECLWNPRLDSYKNKMIREASYKELIKDLKIPNITVNDIKQKIKGIRTTYRKEISVLERRRSQNKYYVPKLFWFEKADSFLRDVSHSRSEQKTEALNDSDKEPEQFVEFFTTDAEIDNKPDCGNESIQEYVQYNPTNNLDDAEQHERLENLPTYNAPSIAADKKEYPEDDQYDSFCQSVAAQLRSIPDAYSRSVAKFKIQQILFEAETGHYKKNPFVTIPVTSNMEI